MQYPQYDYAVIGGDMRQVYLTEELSHHQNRVIYYCLMGAPDERRCSDASYVTEAASLEEAVCASHCVICPIPFSKNGIHLNQNVLDKELPLSSLLETLESGQSFFAGCIAEDFQAKLKDRGIAVYDLMKDHTLALYNTIATAEGALCEALLRSPQNLHHSQCAVLGYGKCGRTLVQYLKRLPCYVSVSSNEETELADAALVADRTGDLKEFEKYAGEFDFIFNTIPAQMITAKILNKLKITVTIIDIASAPGGIDYTEARHLGIRAALCPGLPGKYAPSSSAKAMKQSIEKELAVIE